MPVGGVVNEEEDKVIFGLGGDGREVAARSNGRGIGFLPGYGSGDGYDVVEVAVS